jgi:hypothetical protein
MTPQKNVILSEARSAKPKDLLLLFQIQGEN